MCSSLRPRRRHRCGVHELEEVVLMLVQDCVADKREDGVGAGCFAGFRSSMISTSRSVMFVVGTGGNLDVCVAQVHSCEKDVMRCRCRKDVDALFLPKDDTAGSASPIGAFPHGKLDLSGNPYHPPSSLPIQRTFPSIIISQTMSLLFAKGVV